MTTGPQDPGGYFALGIRLGVRDTLLRVLKLQVQGLADRLARCRKAMIHETERVPDKANEPETERVPDKANEPGTLKIHHRFCTAAVGKLKTGTYGLETVLAQAGDIGPLWGKLKTTIDCFQADIARPLCLSNPIPPGQTLDQAIGHCLAEASRIVLTMEESLHEIDQDIDRLRTLCAEDIIKHQVS